jgi:hypothetical protein
MKSRLVLVLVFILDLLPGAAAAAPADSADDLLARVRAAREARGGLDARLVLTVAPDRTHLLKTVRLAVKTRRDETAVRTLFQCLWPRERRGQAYVFTAPRDQTGRVEIVRFDPPDRLTTLGEEALREPFFDTDLVLEDMARDLTQWPARRLDGETNVLSRSCVPVAFQPPAGSRYTAVRAWISPDILLPLLVEKYDGGGRLLQRVRIERLAKPDEHRWAPASFVVETPERGSSTTVAGSPSSKGAVDVPPEAFGLKALQRGATGGDEEEESGPKR